MDVIAKRNFATIGADIYKGNKYKIDVISNWLKNSTMVIINGFSHTAYKEYTNNDDFHNDWAVISDDKPSEE